ncbi:MAG TPA: S41 family peptidase [Verrucomicrobiae bacterium]|jgi:carboxyl-terminal processing protease|nr:S41 family peptidase [Verrucomicrobiae bacterium]
MNTQNEGNPRPRRLRPGFQVAFIFVFGLGLGVLFDRWALLAFVPANAAAYISQIAQAWNIIERNYVARASVTPEALTYGAISGMVDALGDTGHSVFLNPSMVKELQVTETGGKLKGVGIQVEMNPNRQVVIMTPLDNSPAQRAGIHPGEIIMSVDGRDITGLALSQVVKLISGKVGTPVELGMLNPKTRQLRTVKLVRADIPLSDVSWRRLPGTEVATVRIAGFDDHMSEDLRKALREIKHQEMKGLILDLRNNPGGVLDEAVRVASQFSTGGNVLLVKSAQGKITPVPADAGGLATNIPMTVLINRGSASAAEIVAGALRDARRAKLIGETTFGTGTVLNEFPLSGGAAMLLAVDEWLTPDGKSFWHKGIEPDIEIGLPPGVLPLLPAAMAGMTPEELQSTDDQQLLRALEQVNQQIKTGAIYVPPTLDSTNHS